MKTLLWILGIALVLFVIYHFWQRSRATKVLTFRETIEGAREVDPSTLPTVDPSLRF